MCAYTEKVRKFCVMMKSLGHTVYLYAGEKNEAPCDELITCIPEKLQRQVVGDRPYVHASWDSKLPHWKRFNENAVAGIRHRMQPQDFLCVIGGYAHEPIARALPQLLCVEFGVGYGGVFAKHRVWESYAWMHTVLGAQSKGDAHATNGEWFDAVIPNYFEPKAFPRSTKKGDYYLFMGRLIDRKGPHIAAEVCEKLGARLIVAGEGTPPKYGEFVGPVGPKQRGQLLSKAQAVFVPTIYVEPFGGVAVEAMLCGTPVITTDWGAFTETVVQGVTGFRCRTLKEFMDAAKKAPLLNSRAIRKYAVGRYSLDAVAPQYQAYFERLSTLWGDGWYAQ
jgi:glycosyltransferase involved in cell wall biosynthesis